jgi:hypothetical protein
VAGRSSRAVVLHGPDDEMPTRPVPSVRVTAIGTCSIAVPNLVDTSRTPVQRGEAALAQTRLTFHVPRVCPLANWAPPSRRRTTAPDLARGPGPVFMRL